MDDSAVMAFKTKLRNGLVPLPSRLRTLAGVADGDPVSVSLIQGGIVVTPAGGLSADAKLSVRSIRRRPWHCFPRCSETPRQRFDTTPS